MRPDVQIKTHALVSYDRGNYARVFTACGREGFIDGCVSGGMVTALGARLRYAENGEKVTCERCRKATVKDRK